MDNSPPYHSTSLEPAYKQVVVELDLVYDNNKNNSIYSNYRLKKYTAFTQPHLNHFSVAYIKI